MNNYWKGLRRKRSFAVKVVCQILAGETEKATNTVVWG